MNWAIKPTVLYHLHPVDGRNPPLEVGSLSHPLAPGCFCIAGGSPDFSQGTWPLEKMEEVWWSPLGGGFKYFFNVHPYLGKLMIQFDVHIFQNGLVETTNYIDHLRRWKLLGMVNYQPQVRENRPLIFNLSLKDCCNKKSCLIYKGDYSQYKGDY